MKKILVSLLAFGLLSSSAFSQQNRAMKSETQDQQKHGRHGKKQHQMKMMKDLNLSDAQKTQMKALREEHQNKMLELKKQQSITVKEYNDRKDALMKEQKSKREAILTTEQKNKMAEAKQQFEVKKKEKYEKKLDRMTTKLALSNDQVSKLKSLHDQNEANIKSIRENPSLNSEEKKIQMMTLKQSAVEQRKKILTTEQFNKMEEMKKNKPMKGNRASKK